MKKLMILFVLVFTIAFFYYNVELKSDVSSQYLPNAGIKPGSIFYKTDLFLEKIILLITVTDENKVNRLTHMAEERLAELNQLEDNQILYWADRLFNDYDSSINDANLYIDKLTSTDNVSETTAKNLQQKINNSIQKQDLIIDNVKQQVSSSVKQHVNETVNHAKQSIFINITNIDETKQLYNAGFSYSQILKLQAISELTDKSIDEILALDGVIKTSQSNEKEIDFQAIYETLIVSELSVKKHLLRYKEKAYEFINQQFDIIQ